MIWGKTKRLLMVGVAAMLGALAGLLATAVLAARISAAPGDQAFLSRAFPMPHHVPARPDGIAFRLAMVHDVLVERYLKHDAAYYQARERADRARLARLQADDPERFAVLDDLGVDLERLGRSAEAIDLMRAKLRDQERAGQAGRALYTTYADLGTFLIHASLKPALSGDAPAREQFGEGVAFIRRSVQVNPDAHFGRERWQASVASFLRAAMDDPNLLTTFDCLGNRLDLPIEEILNREVNWVSLPYGRPNLPALGKSEARTKVPAYFEPGQALADPARRAAVLPARDFVTRVGAEQGWEALGEKIPDHRAPVAFDEPMLGIVGMWRQGGGANPHFALAIGETMLRVGQRRIAWEAFERASLLAERFSPQPPIQARLRDHCRARQTAIEETLNHQRTPLDGRHPWREISPPRPDDAPEQLRARFLAELEFGLSTQARYQAFERERLASGVAVDDAHLDDRFDLGPTTLASRSGPEEWFQTVTPEAVRDFGSRHSAATATLGAGVGAIMAVLAGHVRWAIRRRLGTGSPWPARARPIAEFDLESRP